VCGSQSLSWLEHLLDLRDELVRDPAGERIDDEDAPHGTSLVLR